MVSTDLVARGCGTSGVDFLMERRTLAPNIVTNPPYIISLQFVERALELATGKVAMLLRLSWLESKGRGEFFERRPPARVWVFSERLTINRSTTEDAGGGMMAFAWFVWDPDHVGPPHVGWINPISDPDPPKLGVLREG